MFNYLFGDTISSQLSMLSLILSILLVFIILTLLINYIMVGLMVSTVAKEQGESNGFLGWIPIANSYLLIKLAGGNCWFILMYIGLFIPFLSILCLFGIMSYELLMIYNLSKIYLKNNFEKLFIAATVIFPCIWILEYKIYKSAKNKKKY